MNSSGYRVRKTSNGHSSKHQSPESASSSSPDAYQESNPYHYQQYNGGYNIHRSYDPPSRRMTMPSPPPCTRRVAPSLSYPISHSSNSDRLKDSSMEEFSPPRIKRRIAPPPPESFVNQGRHSTSSSNDYNRSYYESSAITRSDNLDFNHSSNGRIHYNGQRKLRGDWKEYDRNYDYPISGHSDRFHENYEQYPNNYGYGSRSEDSTGYINTNSRFGSLSSHRSRYRDTTPEAKVRHPPPPPPPRTSVSTPVIPSQVSSTKPPRIAPPPYDIKPTDTSQNEEGEYEFEEGECVGNEDRLKYHESQQRHQEIGKNISIFDPHSTASLDEQEHQLENPLIITEKDNFQPSTSQMDRELETMPKKPPLPMHLQKSPLKGSFISSSILTRDENNMYTEVKKVDTQLDESTTSSNADENDADDINEEMENISGDLTEGGESVELEEGEEKKNSLTSEYLKQSPHLLIDSKFLTHLGEMHPVSALNELSHRLNWSTPNFSSAFECGPPMAKMYIFKVLINGQTFQPTIAVDNKKDAKQNVAWYALQEMGFVKSDPANPL